MLGRLLVAKLLPDLSFRKYAALHFLSILALAYVLSGITGFMINAEELSLASMFQWPQIWTTIASYSRWLFAIPAFFIIQTVCADLELKIVRAHLIHGMERWQVTVLWQLQSALLASIGVVASTVAALSFGQPHLRDIGHELGFILRTELGYGFYGVIYLNFAILMALGFRRPAPAIGLLLAAPALIEPAIGLLLERYGYGFAKEFLPFACLGTLTAAGPPGTAGGSSLSAIVAVGYGALAMLAVAGKLRTSDF